MFQYIPRPKPYDNQLEFTVSNMGPDQVANASPDELRTIAYLIHLAELKDDTGET